MRKSWLTMVLCWATIGLLALGWAQTTAQETGPASPIVGAEVKVSPEAQSAPNMVQALEKAGKLVAEAHAREADLRQLPGWRRVEEMEKMIAEVDRLKGAGDISRAYELATSWNFEMAQQQVINEALEAMPFLVIGPFGDPRDTDVNAPDKPINPEFRGMLLGYLDEGDKPDLSALKKDFTPDLARKYRVYPGKMVGWQNAVKAEYLSFDQVAADYPYWMIAYAYTEVYCPEERKGAFLVSSNLPAVWIWCNDRLYFGAGKDKPTKNAYGRGNTPFQQGWNRVLIKVIARRGTQLSLRIMNSWEYKDQTPMHDLRFRVPQVE